MTHRLLIDGTLVDGAQAMDVIDPTTAAPFAQAPRADRAQAEQAIAAAKRAQAAWAALGYDGRRPYLERFAQAITDNLADMMAWAKVPIPKAGDPVAFPGVAVDA